MSKVKLRIIEKGNPQHGKIVEYSPETAKKILEIQTRSGVIAYELVKEKEKPE